MLRFTVPFVSLSSEGADSAERPIPFASSLEDGLAPAEFFLAALDFFFAVSERSGLRRLLSSFANVSESHGAVVLPRDAFLWLCHSAEFSAPAIWAIVLPLSTDVSYLSMSHLSSTYSSCFLISSHSVPLLPGRRAFM